MPRGLTYADSDTAAAGADESLLIVEPEAPRRRPLWPRAAVVVGGPLLVSAAAVTILVTRFHTMFLTNDDAAIAAIANGNYTGRGTSSLVVAPAMFGHILRLGYGLVPDLPWYGITLYALQIIAWAAIGAVVFTLRRRPPVAERLVVAAVILAMAPWMILRVSFTPTSLLLGVVGIIVFAVGAKVPGRVGVMYTAAAGVLLGTVYLVRASSFLAVVIVFAPVIAVIAFKAGLRRSAVFALAVGVFVLVGFGTNRLEYSRNAEWRSFMKMNSARKWLHDTPRLAGKNVSDRDLQQIGWTRNDLRLFAGFIYPDPDVYSAQDIRTLATLSPRVRDDISPGHIIDVFRESSDRRSLEQGPALASLAMVGVLLALRRSRAAALVTLVSIVWFVGVVIMVLVYLRLPGRVLVPLEGGAAIIAAVVPAYLTSSRPRTSSRMPWTSGAVLALIALLVAGPAWHGIRNTSRMSRENQLRVRTNQASLDTLEAFDPKGVFVGRGDLIGRWGEPLSTSSAFANPRLVPLGWATNSPLYTARLARLGIHDLYTALWTKRHVYLLGSPDDSKRIARFYRQHRGLQVKFVPRVGWLPVLYGSMVGYMGVWSAEVIASTE